MLKKEGITTKISYEKITLENFPASALKDFCRHQEISECWRNVDGEWRLLPVSFVEEWDADKLQQIACKIREGLDFGYGYMALDGERVVGFATVDTTPIGMRGEGVELVNFQVSEEYRGNGIGKKLFALVVEEAKRRRAGKIYMSAHSSKESQETCRKLGCVDATWVYEKKVKEEPLDVQMEYVLWP